MSDKLLHERLREAGCECVKVLDADGVEINVGDVVWNINNGCEHEVIGLPKGGCYQSVEIRNVITGSKGGVDAPLLTHAKPVFEANGERICVGDTMWFCGDDTGAYTVSAVEETLGGGWCLTVYNDAATIHEVRPSQVTHREPDSLEKLRASIKAVSTVACGASKGEVKEWADRLTALMERGA